MDGLVTLALVVAFSAAETAVLLRFRAPPMSPAKRIEYLPSGIIRVRRTQRSRRYRIAVLVVAVGFSVLMYFALTHSEGARHGSEYFLAVFLFTNLTSAARIVIPTWGCGLGLG